MTFRLLFFLPRRWLIWTYHQAMWERLLDTPVRWLFSSWDKHGVWFPHRGDEVCYTWPWTRQEREGDNRGKAPFISIGFSGTGEWGDARYWTLAELDRDWDMYYHACNSTTEIAGIEWPQFVGSPEYHHRVQEALTPMVEQLKTEIDRRIVEELTK